MDNNLTVACKQKAIRVLSIQKEGKKILKTKDFLTGYKIEQGEKLVLNLTIKLLLNTWAKTSLAGKFKKMENQFKA